MQKYKEEYNKLLTRYFNGCNYLENNPKDIDKYEKELLNILENINNIVKLHPEMNEEEIKNGFKE